MTDEQVISCLRADVALSKTEADRKEVILRMAVARYAAADQMPPKDIDAEWKRAYGRYRLVAGWLAECEAKAERLAA